MDAGLQQMWTFHCPQVAFESEFLLHFLLALSALHMGRLNSDNAEIMDANDFHFNLALPGYNAALAHITNLNADAVCLSSMLICFHALVAPASTEAYSLPLRYFRLCRGMIAVFRHALPWVNKRLIGAIVQAKPELGSITERKTLTKDGRYDGFLSSLNLIENMDPKYESAIGHLRGLHASLSADESPMFTPRHFIAFSALLGDDFLDALEQRQPIALVIVAHFFALAKMSDDVWWLHGVPDREIRGIRSMLPAKWQWAMTFHFG